MGSYTPNKNLYKADPATDGKDTFNITKMLNENWDKLDADTREPTFDELAAQYGVTESYPDADTGTITATIDDSAPVTATRQTIVSKTSSGDLKFVETTTIDETSTVTETTEGSTATTGDTAGQLNLDTIRWRLKRLQAAINSLAADVSDTIDTSLAELKGDVIELESRVDTAEGDITAIQAKLEAQGKKLLAYWEYMKSIYDYECDMPADTTAVPRTYTERLKEGETVKGTCAQTVNADGTYTYVYTIGETTRTQTWTKVNNQWKGEWS